MTILFVTPTVPSSIRPRPYQFIKQLSKNHEIHLVCLVTLPYERGYLAGLTKMCARITPVPHSRARGALNCLRALVTRRPLRFYYFQSSKLSAVVSHALRDQRFDLVHVEHGKAAISLPDNLGAPVVFDAVDCVSVLLERQVSRMAPGWRRRLVGIEAHRTRQEEKVLARRFARVICVSEADRLRLSELGGRQVAAVPNGVDSDAFQPTGLRQPHTIIFAAKLDYFPNADAALFLVNRVMPIVWASLPYARLQIVGSRPPRSVRKLAVNPRVEVTGFVPDLAQYLGRASVAVAPILAKAGMQSKILEAMASGTPVVATSMAAAGLHAEPGKDLSIADDGEAFGRAIIHLLENQSHWQRLAVAGRRVAERYTWDSSVRLLNQVYEAAAVGERGE